MKSRRGRRERNILRNLNKNLYKQFKTKTIMKLSKLMLSAFAAAAALVACNKVETDDVNLNQFKSVELSLANVQFMTKADAGAEIKNGDAVKVSSFQVYFTDGTSLYTPKDKDGNDVVAYYTAAADGSIAALAAVQNYHFLPDAVDKVIVIGNLPQNTTAKTVADLNTTLKVAEQQAQTGLTLYAESQLVTSGQHVETTDGHTALVYKATCNLMPRVARLEVKSVGMTFNANPHLFDKVDFKKIAFVDYYENSNLATATAAAPLFDLDFSSDVPVFNYLNSLTSSWNNDVVAGTALATNAADANKVSTNISYSFFPSSVKPALVMSLDATAAGSTTAAPAYVFTNNFRYGSTDLSAMNFADGTLGFCPGYIYRMDFIFDESNLNHQDKCIDVTVTVDTWKVVAVTPIF